MSAPKLKFAHRVTGAEGVNLYAETDVRATFKRVRREQAQAQAQAEAVAQEQAKKVRTLPQTTVTRGRKP